MTVLTYWFIPQTLHLFILNEQTTDLLDDTQCDAMTKCISWASPLAFTTGFALRQSSISALGAHHVQTLVETKIFKIFTQFE